MNEILKNKNLRANKLFNLKENQNNQKEDKTFERLRNRCLYLIADCQRTEKNIREKIAKGKTQYDEELIDKVIQDLKYYKYIDDDYFAERFIELNKNKYSTKVLKEKLYLKGVPKKIIDEKLSYDNDEGQEKVCKNLLYKKYKNYDEIKDNLDYKEKSKIYAYLFRKGFSYEIIDKILKA